MTFIDVAPGFLAVLNAAAALLVTAGYGFIRRRDARTHRRFMIGALAVSACFMVVYLYYHWLIGNVPFAGTGIVRPVYFTVLASHVILAAVLLPLALVTAGLALAGRTAPHRKVARWTLPIWLYVSVTGIAVYVMAFHIYTA